MILIAGDGGDAEKAKYANSLSLDIERIYEEYKSRIIGLISGNYGKEKEEQVLSMFKEIGLLLSERNNRILDLLKTKYGLSIKENFDFSGGIKLKKEAVSDSKNGDINNFLSKNYVREEGDFLHSRGYGYYFNFEGINNEKGIYSMDPDKYFSNLGEYFKDVIRLISTFNGRKINELSEDEKKVFLIGLEHYKNILFFIQNIIISISNKDYLCKHVLNINPQKFNLFFTDVSEDLDFKTLNLRITEELERITSDYSDIILGIKNDSEINYSDIVITPDIIETIKRLYKDSFSKQEEYLEKRSNRVGKGGRKADIEGEARYINKANKRFILNLLRIIREEDNPIKQLLSCHNISSNIPEENKLVDIDGLLYGGIEMPYLMKYVLTRFKSFNPKDLEINLVGLSNYNNRDAKGTSTLSNHAFMGEDRSDGKRLQLVLDDNIFYGTSLQLAGSINSDRGPIISGVTEVGLRRGNLGKLGDKDNLSFLLSKTPYSGAVTPLEKNRGTYRNLVTRYIKKKLPNLYGKF